MTRLRILRALRRWLPAILMVGMAPVAHAHKPSDSYLIVHASSSSAEVDVRWDIALRDLEIAVGLDADRDGRITWGELRAQESTLFDYAAQRLVLRADDAPCTLTRDELQVDTHTDGAYAVLRFRAHCAAPPRHLGIAYSMLFDLDPTHRGLLNLGVDGTTRSAVFSPDQSTQVFDLADASRWRQFLQFVGDGVQHIGAGYDHLLFLISLLLPAVLVRRDGRWVPVATLRAALLGVLAVVTAFTLSHSITLTLAAFGFIGLPSRVVESGIALSVVLAALNNIFPRVTRRAWLLAFAFGLVHGFGFANVLSDLGLARDALAISLAGFNIGVEIGQLAVVLVVVPLIFMLRERRFYRPLILVGGSSAIVAIATVWFLSRAFNIGLG